ncbi:putative camk protein kinase protein [Zalerion maritima]|uniref:Camk protein kinase protein n=1 Tax=Zalerion maritima TaxID=339359 RepID=A0AAD5RFB4_9PEZI|nr:putative camk protein kinase protein [Zalerion maritima]
MADFQEAPTEEKTEPFSESEIDRRMFASFHHEVGALQASAADPVSLDHLVVDDHHHEQGVRILVRPLIPNRSVSPGNENCRVLALRAEVESESDTNHKVLAVTQTAKDIKFSVRIPEDVGDHSQPRPPVWCELYYDPLSDNQILVNRGDAPITLFRDTHGSSSPTGEIQIVPGDVRNLTPGTWKLRAESTPVLDFRILERRPRSLSQTTSDSELSSMGSTSQPLGKRSFSEGMLGPESPGKRLRTSNRKENGAIVFMTPQPLMVELPRNRAVAKSEGHPMLDLDRNETLNVPGGCELDTYTLTRKEDLHQTRLSTVFTADAQHPELPDSVSSIIVKVLKTAVPQNSRAQESERNVIRQADVWMREFQRQQNLTHKSIVRLYAGDARYLSLYMEQIDARDLSRKDIWRDPSTDMFLGSRQDAERILRDITGGLGYLHNKQLVHNDIKPANILYSPDRGAVLCDFGLSTHLHDPPTNGGTPYYVPPEYIGRKQRGPPSDVWALGVVMLYVLKKMTFPESRGKQSHRKHLYWHISEVNKPQAIPRGRKPPSQPTALEQMRAWLVEVNEATKNLDRNDDLESLVADMLAPALQHRITMGGILSRLGTLTPRTSGE